MSRQRDTMLLMATHLFKIAGRVDAAVEAKMVLDFEIAQSRIHVDRTEAHNEEGHATNLEELDKLMPYWPWKQWMEDLASCTDSHPDRTPKVCTTGYQRLRNIGQPTGPPLYIRNSGYFPRLNALLENSNMETLRAVLRWRVLFAWARFMSSKFLDVMVQWDNRIDGMYTMFNIHQQSHTWNIPEEIIPSSLINC